MKTHSIKKRLLISLSLLLSAILLCLGLALMSGCEKGDPLDKSLMLHLTFDEGSGTTVKDSAKKVPDATVRYVFNDAQHQPNNQDPQWREKGVKGGSLLFDGYSNFIRYDYEDIKVRGDKFSISAYVAPRVFEWDDPKSQENGTDKLTAIVAQMDKSGACGFILGYHRHGNWSFQVGDGENWVSVWNDEGFELKKYEWNHVVASYDGAKGEMCIYLNGELAGKQTFIEGSRIESATDEYLYVGKNAGNPYSNATAAGNMVSGLMDELKLYNAVASAEDAMRLYQANELPEIAFEDIWLQNVLTDDYYKTQLHGGPYQHWMNEPHAPMYYNGKYHLFFQFNLVGPYFHNICWGHLVSDDMVNWKPLKEVITPEAGSVAPDGVWSGGVTYDKNGVPVIFFTAGNDSFRDEGLISNQNVGVAYPKDINDPELTEWVVCDELAIKQQAGQGVAGEFRDMHVWQEGNTWCMLIGSQTTSRTGGTALLFTATNLEVKGNGKVDMNWQYRGPVYQMQNQPSDLGRVWELPVILPVKNEAGTVSKHIFLISPAPADSADNKIYYFLGNFSLQTGKFTPDPDFAARPHLLDYGCNVFTGPSGFVDPVSKNTYIMSIMQDQRTPGEVAVSGWANCVGFARRVWLNDEGTDVKLAPVEALEKYESETLVSVENKSIEEANAALAGKGSDMAYVRVTFKNVNATSFGVRVKKGGIIDETHFTYDVENSTIVGSTMNKGGNAASTGGSGALALNEDGTVTMEIYIDRSLVEAYFNESKAISIRSYADFTSTGIEVFAEGTVTVQELYVASLRSIYK